MDNDVRFDGTTGLGRWGVAGKMMNLALDPLSLMYAGGQEVTGNRNLGLSRKIRLQDELEKALPCISVRCPSLNVNSESFS